MNTFLLTMQYNERLCLPLFSKHYSQYFPINHIHIIDHGSTPEIIAAGCNKIYVPRDRPYSEIARLQLVKNIASGLLQYFDAGIYVDCDELIDLGGFNARQLADSPVFYVAGFDVFWEHTEHGRRLLGYLSPHLCKAAIFSLTPNWVLGFHGCEFEPKTLALPMAHVRFLFLEESSRRLRERVPVHRTMRPEEKAEGIAAQWGSGDSEFHGFYRFVQERLRRETAIAQFAALDASRMYRKHVVKGTIGGAEIVVYSPNGYSPVDDRLFDLTDRFPALLQVPDLGAKQASR